MQPSQLYRRGIIVPLNDRSEAMAREWNITSSCLFLVLNLVDDRLFDELFEKQVFERINAACGLNIDDYEEEILEQDCCWKALQEIQDISGLSPGGQEFLRSLSDVLDQAVVYRRPVFFIL